MFHLLHNIMRSIYAINPVTTDTFHYKHTLGKPPLASYSDLTPNCAVSEKEWDTKEEKVTVYIIPTTVCQKAPVGLKKRLVVKNFSPYT